MTNQKPALVAIVGDLHGGSTTGLCHPTGVQLDDGGWYKPSKSQLWLWQCWTDYWAEVRSEQERLGAKLVVVVNGEPCDNNHHQTPQIVGTDVSKHVAIAIQALEVPEALDPEWYFVRGTEAHSGRGGSIDEAVASRFKATPDPVTGTFSHWHLLLEAGGIRFDITHHGSVGRTPWGKGGAASRLAARLVYDYAYEPQKPHVALRSHCHQWEDSGDTHPIRVVQNGSWQLATAYGHRVAPNEAPGIGGVYVRCLGDRYELVKKQFKAGRSPWIASR